MVTDIDVLTTDGLVRGSADGETFRFLGIPFAAPPFGANRFRFPQPPTPWDGPRDARESGLGVPQPHWENDPFDMYFNPQREGADCLVLDVCTPELGRAGLPVMVWIHGGGFITGTGSAPAHDGRTFARDGIVHVGVNYRLGMEGFLFTGEGADNLGLRDQVAALEWVQRNIAAFGGDPANVTVFAQSAGALALFDLLAMPAARGLFARAIAQSGTPAAAVTVDDALMVTARVAERLGIDPTREAFCAVPLDRTLAETLPMTIEWTDYHRYGSRSFLVSPWRAVYGTESLPDSPADAAVARSSTVPLLAGTVRNEATGFLGALGLMDAVSQPVRDEILSLLGAGPDVLAAYRGARGLQSDRDIVEAAWTDWAFRIPTIRALEQRSAPSHLYEFGWQSPLFPPGIAAAHALEVP
ncbi:MAG: para-nitrobenzyl esterase, partial [Subtercola sp.]|nr:para-nitrobenzyl esterase [Subtercola sp.]